MSDDAAAAPPGKGGKKKLLLMILGALVLLGGGAGIGMYAAGVGLSGDHGPKIDPNAPVLMRQDGHKEEPGHGPRPGEAPDPRVYKASYYTFEQPFTSNLRDSSGILQISIGISTFYDQRVLDRVKDNEPAIRSAVLGTLSEQDEFVISTPEGRRQLQTRLRDTINDALVKATGYAGVSDVVFTNFIIGG